MLGALTNLTVLAGAIGIYHRTECKHKGCHKFVIPHREYCKLHIDDET